MGIVQQHLEAGVALHRLGKFDEAEEIYHSVLNLDPSNPTLLYLLGDIAVRRGHNGLAINLLTTSAQLKPTAEVYTNLGCALKAEQMNAEAKAAWEKALEFGETDEIYSNLATLYADSFEAEKALPLCEKALALNPENPHAHWNRALALLTLGNRWGEAWTEHEWRLRLPNTPGIGPRDFGVPRWNGEHGKRVIVHGEQGIGDEIMFLSCLPDVLRISKEVVVECEPRLMDLVERSFPGVRAYANEAALKAHEEGFDACIPLGSLPRLFRGYSMAFPLHRGYLNADPALVEFWREKFAPLRRPGRPLVGLTWIGGTKTTRVTQRSLLPKDMPFLKNVDAVSLQYGEHARQVAEANGIAFFPELGGRDIEEQAAAVMALDVVITVCQTVVHLCGALGKESWVLTPKLSSWRYGQGDSMPWYPSVKLFRQTEPKVWDGPLAAVAECVERWGK